MNDVFRETKDGIPNLADIAQVLLQRWTVLSCSSMQRERLETLWVPMQIISIRFIGE